MVSSRCSGERRVIARTPWRSRLDLPGNESHRSSEGKVELKTCRVTIHDMEGVEHTVEVTASTLYEAVALGLRQIRGSDWVDGIAAGLNTVKVCVKNVQVEHTVKLGEFTKWVERNGRSPVEVIRKGRIREILGMAEKYR
jgi:hypothetical protein